MKILFMNPTLDFAGSENITYQFIRNMSKDVHADIAVYSGSAKNIKRFEDLGCKIFIMKTSISHIKKHMQEFVEILDNNGPYDILHINAAWTAARCVYGIAAKKRGIKVRIIHSHTSNLVGTKSFTRKLAQKFFRKLVPCACNYRIGCSTEANFWMYGNGKLGKNALLVRNAVDLQVFCFNENVRDDCRKELKISDDCINIFLPGRISRVKNQKFAIDIIATAKEKNFHLYFAGSDENMLAELMAYAEAKKVSEKITYLGVRSDVQRIYNAMDVTVLPSLYEGLGIVVIEAQACGCPTIASTNVPEETAVTDIITYLPIGEEDILKWVDTISNMARIEHIDKTDQVRSAGYDIKEEAQRLESLYRKWLYIEE